MHTFADLVIGVLSIKLSDDDIVSCFVKPKRDETGATFHEGARLPLASPTFTATLDRRELYFVVMMKLRFLFRFLL